MGTVKRLQKELRDVETHGAAPGICLGPSSDDDIFNWTAVMLGEALTGTPYEGGIYHLSLAFPAAYPFKPPKVKFTTKIYHPNINGDGAISLDILSDHWSPALSGSKILMAISSLLGDPNPDDPLVPAIGMLYKANRAEYDYNARCWNHEHAEGPPVDIAPFTKSANKS